LEKDSRGLSSLARLLLINISGPHGGMLIPGLGRRYLKDGGKPADVSGDMECCKEAGYATKIAA
jgi:hypothetical protein